MNVLFSTESPVPVRVTPKREAEQSDISAYLFGGVLLFASLTLGALLRLLALVRML
jgi:hypothetical protein